MNLLPFCHPKEKKPYFGLGKWMRSSMTNIFLSFYAKNEKGRYDVEGTNDPHCAVKTIIHFGDLLTRKNCLRDTKAKLIGEIITENNEWL
jgi:hypothetical protein